MIEAAHGWRAIEWDIFRRVRLPLLSLPIAVVTVWMIINVIKVFDIIYVMTKGGPGGASRVIAYSYYVETFENGKGGHGAAGGVLMICADHPRDGLADPPLPNRGGDGALTIALDRRRPQARDHVDACRRDARSRPAALRADHAGILWLVPTVGLLVTSFRPPRGHPVERLGRRSSPSWTLKNYDLVLEGARHGPQLHQQRVDCVPVDDLSALHRLARGVCVLWIRFPFRDTIFLFIVALMVVPLQSAFVPILIEFQDLGEFLTGRKNLLTGWYWGIWIAHTVFALRSASSSYVTSSSRCRATDRARVDGASNWKIFRSVVRRSRCRRSPSFGIFQFLWVWNDLLMAPHPGRQLSADDRADHRPPRHVRL